MTDRNWVKEAGRYDGAAVRIVVLGGGTAGWMTAAALGRLLPRIASVVLIESEEVGIVGVGEATLPHLRDFITRLRIDEKEFMQATAATFKLGIEFSGFGAIGERYIHPFGTFGRELGGVGFHHFWLRSRRVENAGEIGAYSLGVRAAQLNRFEHPGSPDLSLESSYGYAYQFDATRFGPFLRTIAEADGVARIEGKVIAIERDESSGDVRGLRLDSGEIINGDLFIDCSGFRSLLLGEALVEPWEDWSHWLPCDRAAALPCEPDDIMVVEPYTRAVAMPAGWRWRIPLQHRVGNGYVYSSSHLSDDQACSEIQDAVEGKALADPRVLRFRAGRRKRSWVRNVVAIGLASGFLEPLESTSIYLVQMAIDRLIDLFPIGGITEHDRDEFNHLVDMEYDRIRDFLILHYHATRRDDSEFWNHVRTMEIPESLAEKMRFWRKTARVERYSEGLFLEPSWVAVYLGQGIFPSSYDQRADIPDKNRLAAAMAELRAEVDRLAHLMPLHHQQLASAGDRHVARSF